MNHCRYYINTLAHVTQQLYCFKPFGALVLSRYFSLNEGLSEGVLDDTLQGGDVFSECRVYAGLEGS